MISQDPTSLPRDAKLTCLLLESLGVSEYDPLVIHQLLELSNRHVTQILTDAALYAEHADRKDISLEDCKLALQGKLSSTFTSPPSKDFLLELAEKKNSIPLPQIPEKFGLRLPAERLTITAPQVKILKKFKSSSTAQALAQSINPIAAIPLTQSRRIEIEDDFDMDDD